MVELIPSSITNVINTVLAVLNVPSVVHFGVSFVPEPISHLLVAQVI